MRYGVKLLPQGAIPQDLNMKVRLSDAPLTVEKETQVITKDAPCVSVLAGYSASGNIDSLPGGGPNAVLFTCGSAGGAQITAHGIFCDTDTFDWSVSSSFGGATSTTTVPGTVVLGNPTVDVTWPSDPCADPSNNYSIALRKNGEAWGPTFTINTAISCLNMAAMPLITDTYSPVTATDFHFDITLQSGYTALTPADLTWTFAPFTTLTGTVTPPTITADGPAISDGFTIHTDPSLDGGDLWGTAWQVNFTVGGVPNCNNFGWICDSLMLQFDSVGSPGVTPAGNTESSPMGETPIFPAWDNAYTVDHFASSFVFVLNPVIQSGVNVNTTFTWSVSSGGSPDFDVSDNAGNVNGGTVDTAIYGSFSLTGTNIGGSDPITITITAVSDVYGTAVPRTYPAVTVQSV